MRMHAFIKHYPCLKVLTDLEIQDSHSHISLLLLNAQYALAEREEEGNLLDNINTRTCEYCLRHVTFNQLTIDHFNPRYFKGTNDSNNLKIVCEKCNKAKGAINPETMPVTFSKLMTQLKQGIYPRRLVFLEQMNSEVLSFEERALVNKLIRMESRAIKKPETNKGNTYE